MEVPLGAQRSPQIIRSFRANLLFLNERPGFPAGPSHLISPKRRTASHSKPNGLLRLGYHARLARKAALGHDIRHRADFRLSPEVVADYYRALRRNHLVLARHHTDGELYMDTTPHA